MSQGIPLSVEQREQAQAMLLMGATMRSVAGAIGCSKDTISTIRCGLVAKGELEAFAHGIRRRRSSSRNQPLDPEVAASYDYGTVLLLERDLAIAGDSIVWRGNKGKALALLGNHHVDVEFDKPVSAQGERRFVISRYDLRRLPTGAIMNVRVGR